MKTSTFNFPKRIAMFFLSLSAFSCVVFSQTELTGIISHDSVLSVTGSPYNVPYPLEIASGATLTVESGVIIYFDEYASIHVNGSLIAQEAEFTVMGGDPDKSWTGLYTGQDLLPASVQLSNCNIRNYREIKIENSSFSASACNFTNGSNNGLVASTNAQLTISGGSISSNRFEAKAYYNALVVETSASVILENTGLHSFQHGVFIDGGTLQLNSVTITGTYLPVVYWGVGDVSYSGISDFENNTIRAIAIDLRELHTGFNPPDAPYPYYFPGSLTISTSGILNINAGQVVKFADNTFIYVDGKMKAGSITGEPVVFTSIRDDNAGGDTNADGTITAPYVASWGGIQFNDNSDDNYNLLTNCIFRYAGFESRAAVSTFSASPVIDHCQFSTNYFGMYLHGISKPVITNCTVGSSELTPLAMSIEADPVMSGNVLSMSDNKYDAIGIIGGTMLADGTLKVRSFTEIPNISYFLLDEIIVPQNITLTIEPGITLKAYRYNYNSIKRIVVGGTLNAIGNEANRINFTSARDDQHGNPADTNKDGTITFPEKNDWGGIIFDAGSKGTLDFCRFKYAEISDYGYGNNNTTEMLNYSAIAVIDAAPVISNSEFKDLYHAISCYRSAKPVISNCQMVNISYSPVNISCTAVPDISNLTYTNVGWQALGLIGGHVVQNGTIVQRSIAGFNNITYVLLNNLNITEGTQLTIEPGVVIKMAGYNAYYGNYSYTMESQNVTVEGGLHIAGTQDAPVIITSIKDDNYGNPKDTNGDGNDTRPTAGDWGYFRYLSVADDNFNLAEHTRFMFGGGHQNLGMLHFENAGGTVRSVQLTDSYTFGVYCNGNSAPTLSDLIIQNSKSDPIAMSLTANPTLTNLRLSSNFSNAIRITDNQFSGKARLTPRSTAEIENIAYVIDKLHILSNGKLEIAPGVVVKFRNPSTYILVEGNLLAKGTEEAPIYFTSIKDDSQGGDSNNNGNADAPGRGDWGGEWWYYWGTWEFPPCGIYFRNTSEASDTINHLDYCHIKYCDTGIRTENAVAHISNSSIQQSSFYGACIVGNSAPVFDNCSFYNITNSPVELSLFSSPQFYNCSSLNNGFEGFAVIPETYSQSATVPIRSFGSYSNVPYIMEGTSVINAGTEITIPAGMVFKSVAGLISGGVSIYPSNNQANGFEVNGKIRIEGSSENPVIFTHLTDDLYGNPADTQLNGNAERPDENADNWSGTWLFFADGSDDNSLVNNAIFKYSHTCIGTLSASPNITNSRFERSVLGINMSGVSTPSIDSCVFHDLRSYPLEISLVAYPSSTKDNFISGSSYKVIKVKDEILTRDVVLPQREFGGVSNIPYYFTNYQVGTSASLTIQPGVVCKFFHPQWYEETGLRVFRALRAEGGSSLDSLIIFTSIADDFYGGDSNSDGSASSPADYRWDGIYFKGETLDPMCILTNCVVRYARNGIRAYSASPTLSGIHFSNNETGILLLGASNPRIEQCDFNSNSFYAINNSDKSFDITAADCWWGSNEGPVVTDETIENQGERELLSSGVNYIPWRTTGAIQPVAGDVSLNGHVQAYDASLILKYLVDLLELNATQLQVADVSDNKEVAAYDASLILQHVVGVESTFPAHRVPEKSETSLPGLQLEDIYSDEELLNIPLIINANPIIYGAQAELRYNPAEISIATTVNTDKGLMLEVNNDTQNGILKLALASATGIRGTTTPLTLQAQLKSEQTILQIAGLSINETAQPESEQSVTISRTVTGVIQGEVIENRLSGIYPNPFRSHASLKFKADGTAAISISVVNLLGQELKTIYTGTPPTGIQTLPIDDSQLLPGIYLLKFTAGTTSQLLKFSIH